MSDLIAGGEALDFDYNEGISIPPTHVEWWVPEAWGNRLEPSVAGGGGQGVLGDPMTTQSAVNDLRIDLSSFTFLGFGVLIHFSIRDLKCRLYLLPMDDPVTVVPDGSGPVIESVVPTADDSDSGHSLAASTTTIRTKLTPPATSPSLRMPPYISERRSPTYADDSPVHVTLWPLRPYLDDRVLPPIACEECLFDDKRRLIDPEPHRLIRIEEDLYTGSAGTVDTD